VGETRTNLTLADSQKRQETHIRTRGFSVTVENCQDLLAKLTACLNKGDIVVLSGSLPDNAPPDFYQALINVCHDKSAIAFLDSSGQSLKRGLPAKPYLIKPNLEEFESLVGHCFATEIEMITAAQEVIANGVEWVVISRAEQGALMISKNQVLVAAIAAENSDNIISHVGCGDALLAGLAYAQLHHYKPVEMLKLAVACGTANLFCAEPGKFTQEELARITEQVQIREGIC
jgi:1-phosphofructokinase family hexose kinase